MRSKLTHLLLNESSDEWNVLYTMYVVQTLFCSMLTIHGILYKTTTLLAERRMSTEVLSRSAFLYYKPTFSKNINFTQKDVQTKPFFYSPTNRLQFVSNKFRTSLTTQ